MAAVLHLDAAPRGREAPAGRGSPRSGIWQERRSPRLSVPLYRVRGRLLHKCWLRGRPGKHVPVMGTHGRKRPMVLTQYIHSNFSLTFGGVEFAGDLHLCVQNIIFCS